MMAEPITSLAVIDVGNSTSCLRKLGMLNCSVVSVTNEPSKLSGKSKRGLQCLDGRRALA